jgi:hypothetical protein
VVSFFKNIYICDIKIQTLSANKNTFQFAACSKIFKEEGGEEVALSSIN